MLKKSLSLATLSQVRICRPSLTKIKCTMYVQCPRTKTTRLQNLIMIVEYMQIMKFTIDFFVFFLFSKNNVNNILTPQPWNYILHITILTSQSSHY